MKKSLMLFGLVAIGAGAYITTTAIKKRKQMLSDASTRWHTITVNRPYADVMPNGTLPEPLADIEDMVDIDTRPALGNTATEIAVHLRYPNEDTTNAVRKVRAALRQTQMLLETGEVLQPDRPGSTQSTPLNAPLRYGTQHRFGEGRL